MALILKIKVVPCSGRRSWTLESSGMIKCFLQSPAERGRANDELLKRLSKKLEISRSLLTIFSGATARIKLIKINADIDRKTALAALGLAKQGTFLIE